jgi:hypothetical protein
LNQNPFQTLTAEQEASFLPSIFQRHARFLDICGDPAQPQSFLLFAPRGYGKTSHRMEIARRVLNQPRPRALPVELEDLHLVQRTGKASTTDFLVQLRRQTLRDLSAWLFADYERERLYHRDPQRFPRLYALLHLFYSECLIDRYPPPQYQLVEQYIRIYQQEQRGDMEWMRVLVDLVQGAGFDALYVMVDSVDQIDGIDDDPYAIAEFLAPLLNAPLLDCRGVAFKFFLPAAVYNAMRERGIGRLDRARYLLMSWTSEELCAMLGRRLMSFSQRSPTVSGSVQRFADLCSAPFDVDRYLVELAGLAPRELLSLCEHVVRSHCALSDDLDAPIDLNAVLERFPYQRLDAHMIARPQDRAVGAAPPPVVEHGEIPLLYYDARGDVWLGEQRLLDKLSRLTRLCMAYFWQHRQRLITHDELTAAIYKGKYNTRVDTDLQQNMVKVVQRLRKSLEPERQRSDNYIEDVPGTSSI